MSESNTPRSNRRRSERAEQLYNARMLPDADEPISYEPTPVQEEAPLRSQAYGQSAVPAQADDAAAQYTSNEPTGSTVPVSEAAAKEAPSPYSRQYDPALYTSNEPTGNTVPVSEAAAKEAPSPYSRQYDPALYTSNEPTGNNVPVGDTIRVAPGSRFRAAGLEQENDWQDAAVFPPVPKRTAAVSEVSSPVGESAPSERSQLAANLSAYYRRAANVSAQEDGDPFASLDLSPADDGSAFDFSGEEDASAAVTVYQMQQTSWALEEQQAMLTGEDADGYQVKTEEHRSSGKRRRKKRLLRRTILALALVVALGAGLWLLAGPQGSHTDQPSESAAPVITPTPQPIRGYDAAPAMAVADKTSDAIEQIGGSVEMATCAVTDGNVLTRSMRADGLYDYYLFASDGRLLAYFDKLTANDMFPMSGGGFYTNMYPWLVDEEGRALLQLDSLQATLGKTVSLRPMHNGWALIRTEDGQSNLISREGQLLSRLWFCRSFSMTGTETIAYVDTGVEGSATRYTLYALDGKGEGAAVKWRDAADDQEVVTAALGMVYLQNGELYQIASLLEDPAAIPLTTTPNVRFYLDCNAMVVQDAATGKYALYVNNEQHYDFVYDSILPVESDVRWQGEILPGTMGQAMVLRVTNASYPQPLSHYFVLSRDGTEEYVALSAVTNSPILPD